MYLPESTRCKLVLNTTGRAFSIRVTISAGCLMQELFDVLSLAVQLGSHEAKWLKQKQIFKSKIFKAKQARVCCSAIFNHCFT